MVIEEILYKLDKSKIKIVSGDVPAGYWNLKGTCLEKAPTVQLCKSTGTNHQDIDLTESIELSGRIVSVEMKKFKETDKVASFAVAGLGALIGRRFFGLAGAVGGALFGYCLAGNQFDMGVNIYLTDGRKIVAVMDHSTYQRIAAIANQR